MIEKLAKRTVKWLQVNELISNNETAVYEYAAFCLLMKIVPLLLIEAYACIKGSLLDTNVICAVFLIVRKYSGGYHAKTPLKCVVSSTVIFITLTEISKYYYAFSYELVMLAFLILGAIIYVKSPVKCPNKTYLREYEIIMKRKVLIINICLFGLFIWLFCNGIYSICFDMFISMFLVTVLLFLR